MMKQTHGYTDNEFQLSCGPCCVGLFLSDCINWCVLE
jgi:hypothetical protein